MKRAINLLILLAASATLSAQIDHIPGRDFAANVIVPQTRRQAWTTQSASPIEQTGVEVKVDIVERTATTTLEIALSNPSDRRQEAELIIPVPAGAVVRGFAYQGSSGQIEAKILSKEEARRIYQGLVARIKDPALVEFMGYNLIRSSVFPVEAHGTQRVRVTYEHLLQVDGARVDYVLPRSESLGYDVPWSITVDIQSQDPIATVYSPSHKVYTHRDSDTKLSVKIDEAARTQPGAFRLSVLHEGKGLSASLFAYPDTDQQGGYFMLLASVPDLQSDSRQVIQREVTLVIDRSGSMRGDKIEQAKEAALQILAGLKPGEAFNVITYSDSVDRFSDTPVQKDKDTEKAASQYIQAITANGGTNLYDALQAALGQKPAEGFLPLVLFLTDGLPTVGQTDELSIRQLVAQANPHQRRVFTFGVGFDVNAPLLEALADKSRGRAEFVLPQEDVEVKVGKVFASLGGPVLANPKLAVLDTKGQAAQGRVQDLLPGELPDLYASDQLVLLGRYVGNQPMTLAVQGQQGDQAVTWRYDVSLERSDQAYGFVPRLWASRKIADLIDRVRQMGADASISSDDPKVKELTDEIVRLSTEFGILTEYTAFLAREGTDLTERQEVQRVARQSLEARAMRVRSGIKGVNQSFNMKQQKAQTQLNVSNSFLDENMQMQTVQTVQQINDLAFYHRNNQWVDSRLVQKKADSIKPDQTVTLGTPEYFALTERLAREHRQGALAFESDVLLDVDGQIVLVKNSNQK